LENGYIWIGTANLDPQGNPINVYWDAALTIPAAQPIRTLNGYPSRSGTPARIYVNSDYSIRVQNSKGSLVYSAHQATERYGNVINANGVVYAPPFTGGVATTVEAKLAQTVSVKDFGAVGDGVADDTAAIQDAIAANPYAPLYFPAGTYLTSPIAANQSIYGDGPYKTIIKAKTGSTGFLLRAKSFSGQYSVRLQDFQLLANGAGQSGLDLEGATGTVERLRMQGFDTVGMQFGNAAVAESGCFWSRASEIFIVMTGGTGAIMDASPGAANANLWQNVYVAGSFVTGMDIRSRGNTVQNGTVEWTSSCTDVIKISGSANVLDNMYCEAVGGAQPTALFNFTGNSNAVRSFWLQAALNNNLYKFISDTGYGNTYDIPHNLRFSSILNQSEKNYMPNPQFKLWTASNVPYGYIPSGGTVAKDASTLFNGNPTVKMTLAANAFQLNCTLITSGNSVTDYLEADLQGQTVSVSVACKTTLAGYGGLTYTILAPSGNINGNTQCSHSGSGNWEIFSDTFRVPDDATQIIVAMRTHAQNTVGTGDIWYGSPSFVLGASAAAKRQEMLSHNEIVRTSDLSFPEDVVNTDGPMLRLQGYYLWADSSGKLRIASTRPTNFDTDGTVVGTQT
jgi:hypothetical protein